MPKTQNIIPLTFGDKFKHHYELSLESTTPWVDENVTLIIKRADLRYERGLSLGDITTNRGQQYSSHLTDSLLEYHGSEPIPAEIIRAAPIWIEELIIRAPVLIGYAPTDLQRCVIAYRLTEALIGFTQTAYPDTIGFEQTLILLTRLKFNLLRRYAQHNRSKHPPIIDIFEGGFNRHFLRTHKVYADLLIEQPDQIRLALRDMYDVEIPLSVEAETLLYDPLPIESYTLYTVDRSMINTILQEEPEGIQQVDQILRRIYLYYDDIAGATQFLANNIKTSAKSKFKMIFNGMLGLLIKFGNWAIILSALLWTVFITSIGLNSYRYEDPTKFSLFISVIVIAIGPPLLTVILALTLRSFTYTYQLLYPYAIRVPAMIVVGAFAVNEFLHVADISTMPIWFDIVIIALLCFASFLYMYIEVSSRKLPLRVTINRGIYLFIYTAAIAIWVSMLGVSIDVIYGSAVSPSTSLIQLIPKVINGIAAIPITHLGIHTALILMIGVFTQSFWEDRSLAEPL